MQQKYIIFIAVIILAFLAGNFAYPDYFDKSADFLNHKFHWTLPHFWQKSYVLGLDLQGGVSLLYQADLSKSSNKGADMDALRDLIERRVNAFGVSESVITVQKPDRLLVELPGITNVQEAIKRVGDTPYLEFDEARTQQETDQILAKIKELEAAQKSGKDVQKIKDFELAFQNPYFKPTQLTGKYLNKDGTNLALDQTTGRRIIELTFNSEGAKLFEEITARNIGKKMAILLDGNSIIDSTGDGVIDINDFYQPYAPVIQDKISGGKAQITGNISVGDAQKIVSRLKQGALPVKIGDPISQETVGPTLGSVSLQKSLWAGMLGLLSVMIFMIIFYRLPGLLASIALLIYIALVLAIFKLSAFTPWPITLSLAGIGGFILSIGMAVDANILIFARMREELRDGKDVAAAIKEGFHRAWPSIRDSNLNSLLVCLILTWVSTSFIRGFAINLALGILVSMFSAIFITRIFLMVFIGPKLSKLKWLL